MGDVCDSEVVDRAVAGMDKVIYTISNFRHGGSDKDVRTQSMSRVLKMS